jgi:hypothetical protein
MRTGVAQVSTQVGLCGGRGGMRTWGRGEWWHEGAHDAKASEVAILAYGLGWMGCHHFSYSGAGHLLQHYTLVSVPCVVLGIVQRATGAQCWQTEQPGTAKDASKSCFYNIPPLQQPVTPHTASMAVGWVSTNRCGMTHLSSRPCLPPAGPVAAAAWASAVRRATDLVVRTAYSSSTAAAAAAAAEVPPAACRPAAMAASCSGHTRTSSAPSRRACFASQRLQSCASGWTRPSHSLKGAVLGFGLCWYLLRRRNRILPSHVLWTNSAMLALTHSSLHIS